MRVRFIKDTPQFGKDYCGFLPDDQAAEAIKRGHAVKIEDAEIVDTPMGGKDAPPSEVKKRITFKRDWSTQTEDGKREFRAGAREYLNEKLADKAIKAGAAQEVKFVDADKDPEPEAAAGKALVAAK